MVTASYEQPCHRPRYETYAHVRPSTYRGNENGDMGGKKIGVPPKSLENGESGKYAMLKVSFNMTDLRCPTMALLDH